MQPSRYSAKYTACKILPGEVPDIQATGKSSDVHDTGFDIGSQGGKESH